MTSFIGLEREFSYSVAPLAATDQDLTDFYKLRMVPEHADTLPVERIMLLEDFSQLAVRNALRIGYRLTNKDTTKVVVRCLESILQEQGIKTGYPDGR